MHGRVKTRTTEEQRELARQEKCKKAKSYQNAMKIILEKRSSCIYDQEALDVTANVLLGNPDIITLWNYRREIFLNMKSDDLEKYQQLLEKDLSLTEQCLRLNPKSYGSWHHRIWVLDNLPEPNWEKELQLCTKYLQLDERNFHCWDYRRIVTKRSNISDLSEYNFTLEKIQVNFSNYSAWHLRSKLLPRIFPDPEKKFPIDEAKHKEELELVESAAFTDPNDQSAWFYLRWLLGLTEPKISFVCVEIGEENIVVVLSKTVKLDDESKLGVKVNIKVNEEPSEGMWTNCQNEVQSCVWIFQPNTKVKETDTVTLVLECNGIESHQQTFQGFKTITNEANFLPKFSLNLMETLTNQLSSCEQLLELEPDSKWTLLTSIFLMLSIDDIKYKTQIMECLDKLRKIDSLRNGYYLDLRSKIVMESAIMENLNKSKKFQLKNQNLTSLYHLQYLYNYEEVDLSCNFLTSESLKNFCNLPKCKYLDLSSNKIKDLREFPVMPNLEVLILDDNLIEDFSWEVLKNFPSLKELSVNKNPFACGEGSVNDLATKIGNVKLNINNS